MTQEKKNKAISTGVTIVVMILIIILLSFCSLKSVYPPPPPRKVIMIEMNTEFSGGGGGGGGSRSAGQDARVSVPTHSRDILSAHDISLPSIPNAVPIVTSSDAPANQETAAPTPNPNAQYRPGMGGGGTGSGGGSGSGHGPGFGSGVGAGTGSGSGGGSGSGHGPGYGTGNRGYTHMPNLTISENGRVYVEVRVAEDGTVTDARVISNNNYPTTITNAKIQQECVAKAKTARYKPGKEELRIIVFSL